MQGLFSTKVDLGVAQDSPPRCAFSQEAAGRAAGLADLNSSSRKHTQRYFSKKLRSFPSPHRKLHILPLLCCSCYSLLFRKRQCRVTTQPFTQPLRSL